VIIWGGKDVRKISSSRRARRKPTDLYGPDG
jgi:hypothetical protein